MTKLRFGICGLGFMGRAHFVRLRENPRAEIVAVCDQDPALRRGEWGEHAGNLEQLKGAAPQDALAGIRAYATTDELIADPDVEAVFIALPTALHAAVTVAALNAGKHVLCEKPMALTVAECNRMVSAAEQSDRTLMIAQCIRFWPQYDLIRQHVQAGLIGDARFMTLRRLGSPPTYSSENWLLDGTKSGGAILDLHVHDVDFAHYLFGIPDEISARGTTGPSGAIDHVAATYAYRDGRYVVLEGGWALAAPWPFEMSVTVHGEKGTLGWHMSGGDDVLHYSGKGPVKTMPVSGDALSDEQDYFIERVLAGDPVDRCLPKSSRASVALSWLERRAVETSKTIPVSDRLRAQWGM